MEGRHLRVDRAARPTTHGEAEVEYDRTLSVFVGNMHFSTMEEDVIRHFHAGARDYKPLKNAVVAVRMVHNPALALSRERRLDRCGLSPPVERSWGHIMAPLLAG